MRHTGGAASGPYWCLPQDGWSPGMALLPARAAGAFLLMWLLKDTLRSVLPVSPFQEQTLLGSSDTLPFKTPPRLRKIPLHRGGRVRRGPSGGVGGHSHPHHVREEKGRISLLSAR